MADDPKTTPPSDLYALPYAKRRALERAISGYLNPANPRDVSLREGHDFVQSAEWPRLYAAVSEALWPTERLTGADIAELFRISQAEGVLHD
jgi:hypothetical protein